MTQSLNYPYYCSRPGSVVVQFRSFFIHNTVSVADSNGNTQPKQIDMAAITKVIVDEIKAKKQASSTNSLLGKADETSILLAEGEGTVTL